MRESGRMALAERFRHLVGGLIPVFVDTFLGCVS